MVAAEVKLAELHLMQFTMQCMIPCVLEPSSLVACKHSGTWGGCRGCYEWGCSGALGVLSAPLPSTPCRDVHSSWVYKWQLHCCFGFVNLRTHDCCWSVLVCFPGVDGVGCVVLFVLMYAAAVMCVDVDAGVCHRLVLVAIGSLGGDFVSAVGCVSCVF